MNSPGAEGQPLPTMKTLAISFTILALLAIAGALWVIAWRMPGPFLTHEVCHRSLAAAGDKRRAPVYTASHDRRAQRQEETGIRKDGSRTRTSERVRDTRAAEILLRGNRPRKYRDTRENTAADSYLPAEAAILKALSTGILAQVGNRLAMRYGSVSEERA